MGSCGLSYRSSLDWKVAAQRPRRAKARSCEHCDPLLESGVDEEMMELDGQLMAEGVSSASFELWALVVCPSIPRGQKLLAWRAYPLSR